MIDRSTKNDLVDDDDDGFVYFELSSATALTRLRSYVWGSGIGAGSAEKI